MATRSSSKSALEPLNRLIGSWTTEATHTAMPGLVVRGTVSIEWLEGEQFLIHRARTDHPKFPDSISVIGFNDEDRVDDQSGEIRPNDANQQMKMQYSDSRGVFRIYDVS